MTPDSQPVQTLEVDPGTPARARGEATLAAARRLMPMIRAASQETEAARTLPADVVAAIRDAGVFRMTTPRDWGGPELPILEQFEIIETLAMADGSAGWSAYIGSTSGFWTAFLDQDIARAMYPELDLITGGVPFPTGVAEASDGGYRVTGRWSFGSGVSHSDWMVAGCVVMDRDEPVVNPDGSPTTLVCFLPSDDWQVIDNWSTTGLRGTGSHDYAVSDVFVPVGRTFNLFTGPIRRTGALYAMRHMVFFNHSAVALGIARAAVSEAVRIAGEKRTMTGTPLADESRTRTAVAEAEALVGSARSYCVAVMGDIWDTLVRGEEPSIRQRSLYRLAIANAHRAAVTATSRVYHMVGTTAIRAPGVLDRCLRDIHTANQHLVASSHVHEVAGAVLLGRDAYDPTF